MRTALDLAPLVPAPPTRCARINLGYLAPASIDVAAWQGREDEGVPVVPRAGEWPYRVADAATE